jgi:uncharacterized membrane protein
MFSKADIERYFTGEKQEAVLFMIIGGAAIITAILLFIFLKSNIYKGLAIPLFAIGVILGIVGFSVYRSSDEYRKRNVYAYDMNPAELKNKELPRMEKVLKNFTMLRYTELFLLLVGLALYIYFIRDIKHDLWRGFGLGLAIMAVIALTMDLFAERRGRIYKKGLETFIFKPINHGLQ